MYIEDVTLISVILFMIMCLMLLIYMFLTKSLFTKVLMLEVLSIILMMMIFFSMESDYLMFIILFNVISASLSISILIKKNQKTVLNSQINQL